MTKDVRDAALLLEALAGYDAADSTSVHRPVPNYLAALTGEVKNLRIGVPAEYFVPGMQQETEAAVRLAIRHLEKNGAIIEEVSLPHSEYAVAVYYIVATAEASSNLARYDGMRYGHRASRQDLLETYLATRAEGFGAEVKRRIMLGTYALSAGYYDAYYLKAQQVRALIKKDFEDVFQRVDAIITPTAPTTAFKIGEKTREPLQMYLSDIFTISVNLAGLPAVSLPCGFDAQNLPIGMQIIGKPFDEATILTLAYGYEQSTAWRSKKPVL
jgi:aspartyl-tRNA(Asn)/glutamyl-tRNA(Gln) amidotransferase subunit A